MSDGEYTILLQSQGMSADEIAKQLAATASVRKGNTTILIPMGYPLYVPIQGPPFLFNGPKEEL